MIERPKYLKQLIDAKENGFPTQSSGQLISFWIFFNSFIKLK